MSILQRVPLGRTGLQVSVAGLGAGGHSRLGLARGKSDDEAVAVIHTALERGVNFVDTAITYGTEEVVGRALQGRRDGIVLSTKVPLCVQADGSPSHRGQLASRHNVVQWAEASLRRLRTDHIDILFLHAVTPELYLHAREELCPALRQLKEKGKIGAIGLSEHFMSDTGHRMLNRAVDDDCWDVVMVGFNVINQSAAFLLRKMRERGIGTVCAFAVRGALSNRERARKLVLDLVASGQVDARDIDETAPLDFLIEGGCAENLPDAAYRFCRHAEGVDTVLTGTGDAQHLRANLTSIAAGPLHHEAIERARRIFARVDSVSAE